MAIDPTLRVAELKEFHNSLDDEPVAPGHPWYVEGIHAAAGDPIEDLKTQIDFNDSANVYFFSGQRGTGKSSELRRLHQMLEAEDCVVLLADMSEYLSLTEPVELGDFMISLMGALSDRVQDRLGQQPATRPFWQRIADFLKTEVKLDEIDLGVDGSQIKLSLKDDPTFKQRIQKATTGLNVKLVKQAREFSVEVVELLRAGQSAKKIVFIVDSVERIRADDSKRAEEIYRSVVNLFSSQIDNLRFPTLHVVYSVPPYLTALAGGMGGHFGGAIYSLPSVHVFEKNSRTLSAAGVEILRSIVAKRYPGWADVFDDANMKRIAENSGGDIRDFFRILRLCLLKAARPSGSLPVALDIIEEAEHMVRNDMLPIAANDMAWLNRIGKTHQCELMDIDELDTHTLARYLNSNYVQNYRDRADWYDVHPLLRDIVDAYVPTVAERSDSLRRNSGS